MEVKSELRDAQLEVKSSDNAYSANKKGLIWFNKTANKVMTIFNTAVDALVSETFFFSQIESSQILADVNLSSIASQDVVGASNGDVVGPELTNIVTFTSTGKSVKVRISSKYDPENFPQIVGMWATNEDNSAQGEMSYWKIQLIDESDDSVLDEIIRYPHYPRTGLDSFTDTNTMPYDWEFIIDSPDVGDVTLGLKINTVAGVSADETKRYYFGDMNIKVIRI